HPAGGSPRCAAVALAYVDQPRMYHLGWRGTFGPFARSTAGVGGLVALGWAVDRERARIARCVARQLPGTLSASSRHGRCGVWPRRPGNIQSALDPLGEASESDAALARQTSETGRWRTGARDGPGGQRPAAGGGTPRGARARGAFGFSADAAGIVSGCLAQLRRFLSCLPAGTAAAHVVGRPRSLGVRTGGSRTFDGAQRRT